MNNKRHLFFITILLHSILLFSDLLCSKEHTQSLINLVLKNNALCYKTYRFDNLIKLGADVNAKFSFFVKDSNGKEYFIKNGTLLHFASVNNPIIVRKLLKNKANVNIKDDLGNNALHWACIFGCKKSILLLIGVNNNIDFIDQKNDLGCTPFFYSVINNHLKAAKILLKYRVNVQIIMNDGKTCIHWALSYKDCCNFIKRLLAFSIKLELPDKFENRPLHQAVIFNRVKSAKVLISKGVDINAMSDGQTALSIAIKNNFYKIIEQLLSNSDIFLFPETIEGLISDKSVKKESKKVLLLYFYMITILSNGSLSKVKKIIIPKEIAKHIVSFISDFYTSKNINLN